MGSALLINTEALGAIKVSVHYLVTGEKGKWTVSLTEATKEQYPVLIETFPLTFNWDGELLEDPSTLPIEEKAGVL